MRMVIISDTHLREPELPDGDVLIHCGDLLSSGYMEELPFALDWLAPQAKKFQHMVFVPGNHDRCFEKWTDFSIKEMENHGITVLLDRKLIIEGIKFYGSPWQPEFYDWAFNLPRGDELATKWAAIPEDTDVLITHGPPYGIMDYVIWDEIHVGCADLMSRVLEVRPKIHCFGHIHGGYGICEHEGITFVNASICDERYNPTNAPHVVDI